MRHGGLRYWGYLLWGPYYQGDATFWGLLFGSPICVNPHIHRRRAKQERSTLRRSPARSLSWHRLRGATEGGQGTKQSTPTEALDPLDQPTTNQPKTPSTLLSLGAWPDLEPKNSTGYIDPLSFYTNSFLQYKLQLRTPPVLGFPRTQTGGADLWPKTAIKAAASCLECKLWFYVIQDEFIAHWLNTLHHRESFYHHDSLVIEDPQPSSPRTVVFATQKAVHSLLSGISIPLIVTTTLPAHWPFQRTCLQKEKNPFPHQYHPVIPSIPSFSSDGHRCSGEVAAKHVPSPTL